MAVRISVSVTPRQWQITLSVAVEADIVTRSSFARPVFQSPGGKFFASRLIETESQYLYHSNRHRLAVNRSVGKFPQFSLSGCRGKRTSKIRVSFLPPLAISISEASPQSRLGRVSLHGETPRERKPRPAWRGWLTMTTTQAATAALDNPAERPKGLYQANLRLCQTQGVKRRHVRPKTPRARRSLLSRGRGRLLFFFGTRWAD